MELITRITWNDLISLSPTSSVATDVYALFRLLEIFQPLAVAFQLLLEYRVFMRTTSVIILESSDAIESLKIQPASESDANAVHDEVWLDVNLRRKLTNESEN